MTDGVSEPNWRELYAEAFRRFGPRYLWNCRQHADPEPANAVGIGRALRQEGDMAARRFAERLEKAARHAD